MDKDDYHSRLDRAKETLLAKKHDDREDESHHKKKKKHKQHRHSYERSRSREKKHKHKSDDYSHERSKKEKERERSRDKKRKERSRDSHSEDRKRKDRGYQHQERGPRREHYQAGREDRRNKAQVEKDPYFDKRREIERVRLSNPAKAQELQKELEAQIIIDEKDRQIAMAKEKFQQAQKEMEEARREDLTILVYCLPLKAKERDIWNFFYKANCGKIRDIQIIRDLRSRKSKGIAYVEFYTAESVQKALLMSERPFELKKRMFMGLKIQHSQAEKNRMGIIAKRMRLVKPEDPIEQQKETIRRQTKVFVGGLTDKLAQMDESSLKELFEPFGQIEYVDIHRDPQTGKCKGYAFIQYVDIERAKVAVKDMNGLEIGGQKIQVQLMNIAQKGDINALEDVVYSAGTKGALRGMLAGGVGAPTHSNLQRPPISTLTTPYLIMTNMFKMQGTTPAFFQEMRKEVQKQCEEFGTVERIFVEKNNQGNIWIKYSDSTSASKAQQNLNGKFFDNVKIFCYFVTEKTYQDRVGI